MWARFFFLLKLLVLAGLVLLARNPTPSLDASDVPMRVLYAAIYFGIVHLTIDILQFAVVLFFQLRMPWRKRVRNNLEIGVRQIGNVFSVFAFLLVGLYAMNIDIVGAFTSLSIVAAGLAIVSKDYIANVVNGFIIIFGNQLAINEYVKIGSVQGKIQDITLVHIHILTDYNELVFYPNGSVLSDPIVNYTRLLERQAYLDFELPIAAMAQLKQLEHRLHAHLEPHKEQWLTPPALHVEAVTYYCVKLRYFFSFQTADRVREMHLKHDLNADIASWLAQLQNLPKPELPE